MKKIIHLVLFTFLAINCYAQPDWTPVTYTNSTIAYFIVTIDGEPGTASDIIGAFVGDECRAVANLIVNEGDSYASLVIQGETVEDVTFKIWDADRDLICNVYMTIQTNPGHSIGDTEYIEILATDNNRPIANAGTDQKINEGENAELDGSASSDPDSDPITYLWSAPDGITLSDETVAKPTFDIPLGAASSYEFTLLVYDDSMIDSYPDTVVLTVNHQPIANAGADQSADIDDTVELDGSASSDPNADAISYLWSAPTEITLSDATVVNPTFDVPQSDASSYKFTLIVNDGMMDSEIDTVKIIVNATGTDDKSWSDKVKVFPNPASTSLSIEIPGFTNSEYTILLTDIAGRKVETRINNGNTKTIIDISNYAKGIYTLSIAGKGIKRTEKIIIK